MAVLEFLFHYVFMTLLGLMLLVWVHELGHFLFAKLFGVRCDVFSIGFGRRLVGYKWGDTDYRICAIPLGGYVKLAGHGTDRDGDAPDEIGSKPIWQRFLILFGGPGFNYLFAVLLLAVTFSLGTPKSALEDDPAILGYVMPASAAAEAGLQEGDTIVSIDGQAVSSRADYYDAITGTAKTDIPLTVSRNGETVLTTLTRSNRVQDLRDFPGFVFREVVLVATVMPDSPADLAGMQAGDAIEAVGATPVDTYEELRDTISASGAGTEVAIQVRRGEESLILPVTPEFNESLQGPALGVQLDRQVVMEQLPPHRALTRGVTQTNEFVLLIGESLGMMFTEGNVQEKVGGPAQIANVAGEASRNGIQQYLFILALLSLNLGIMNLLPIPVLDGGHIVFLGVEALLGKERMFALRGPAMTVGMVFILALTVFALFNDVRMIVIN